MIMTDPLSHNTSHVSQGLGLLTQMYRDQTNIRALASALLKQVQDLEDAAYAVIIGRWLTNAVGVQLDTIGRIVDEGRQDRDDDLYRQVLRVKIRALRTKGHTDDVLDVMALTLLDYTYLESYPADFRVDAFALDSFAPWLFRILNLTKSFGVGHSLVYTPEIKANSFIFSDSHGEPTVGKGFSSVTDSSVGGRLGAVLS